MAGLTRPMTAVPASVSVGVLATLSMDAVFLAASQFGGASFTSDKIGLELVGRWAGGLAQGRLRHADMTAEPALRGEAALGLAVHYVTGVMLTEAYYQVLRRGGHKPGVLSATAFGAATALLPLLVMYPSWGLGPFAVRSGEATRLLRIMLLGHTAFGAAIGLWTMLLDRRRVTGETPQDS
ncbi:MAG: DUF2938 family protein [Actinobacteria bacterium]|nr:DUF2938 family protein [Actinomycetota bacterium]